MAALRGAKADQALPAECRKLLDGDLPASDLRLEMAAMLFANIISIPVLPDDEGVPPYLSPANVHGVGRDGVGALVQHSHFSALYAMALCSRALTPPAALNSNHIW